MQYKYIRKRLDTTKVLVCNEKIFPIFEKKKENEETLNKSWYVPCEIGYFGILPSSKGPILFFNDEKYLFSDPSWNIEVIKHKGYNEAIFTGFSTSPLKFNYPPVELVPWDPYSEEDFDDFFIWLMIHRFDKCIYDNWTDKK